MRPCYDFTTPFVLSVYLANLMSEPLQRVADLFAEREQRALTRLGEARVREQRAQADLARIHTLGRDYRETLRKQQETGIGAASLKQWQGFIGQLDNGAGRQQRAVDRVQQQSQHAEAAWFEARQRAAAMAKVQARRQQHAAEVEHRAEQRLQDELAARSGRHMPYADDQGTNAKM